MIVKVLGSAAGGGFPQWNCACSNCARLRRRELLSKARTQSQLAVSADGRRWHLLNASPDLRVQIESHKELQPDPRNGSRHTPIQSAVLTNADLDHVLGLLLLRESQPLSVYASRSVSQILLEDNSMFGMLRQSQAQSQWNSISLGLEFELKGPSGEGSGLYVSPYSAGTNFPRYVRPERAGALDPREAVLGLVVRQQGYEKKIGYFPGLPDLTPELEAVFAGCDALFVDGTFWTDDELQKVRETQGARTALQMGHLPLSGPNGTIARMARLKRPRKIFVHINNTNPILDASSEAHHLATLAGWEVAQDGLELTL